MEGRTITPPTTSGVQKRARHSKEEGLLKPNKAKPYNRQTCASGAQRLPSEAWEKHPVNAHWGSKTARHGRKGTWMRTVKKG
jgi:hypothetical protein